MNKIMRRKKKQVPYQPKKSGARKRVRQVWDGVVTEADRYWAAHDSRQLAFVFDPTPEKIWASRILMYVELLNSRAQQAFQRISTG